MAFPSLRRGVLFAVLPVVVVTACAAQRGARVLEHHGRWESGYGETWYNVVGRLKNTSGHPLAYVKLRIDAVDAQGKVVASTETFNESAEGMTVLDLTPEAMEAIRRKVKPLGSDSEERFRGSFLKDETPEFTDYRVTVIETPPAR